MFGPLMGFFIRLQRPPSFYDRVIFPFVEQVFLSFCGGGLFILLWWRSIYSFVVNNVGGFGCMPGFARNIAHFIFHMFWVILFGCYFVKIHYFLIVKQTELLVSNKILYEGMTLFNLNFSFKFEKKKYDNNCEKQNCVISAVIFAF